MGDFLKLIENEKLETPIRPRFSEARWRKAGASIDAHADPDDARVYEAGLWFANRLTSLRREVAQRLPTPKSDHARDRVARMAVGMVNRDAAIASARVAEAMASAPQGTPVLINRIAEEKIALPAGDVSLDAFVESCVDGLRFALLPPPPCDDDTPPAPLTDTLAATRYGVNAGVLYHTLEELWNQCRWNGYGVAIRADHDCVAPTDIRRAAAEAVSQFRRNAILLEWPSRARQTFATSPPAFRELERSRRRVIAVERRKGGLAPLVGPASDAEPTAELVARLVADEPYLRPFLDEPLIAWDGLTIRELLDVWMFLAPLAAILRDRMPGGIIKTPRDLEAFAPRISKRALEQAVHEGLGVPPPKAKLLVSRFLWLPSARNSIWHTPFVPVSNNDVLVVVPALAAPNLLRSIEHWMAEGGLELEKRGDTFECSFRERAANWFINRVPALKRGGVAPRPVDLGIHGVGDLDAVMWFGDAILVCELKCQRYPATEVERFRYMERLEDAAEQLRVRRVAIEADGPAALVQRLRSHGYTGDGSIIEYAIVVNTPFGALEEVAGFPVVDDLILMRYVEGFAKMLVEVDALGNERAHEHRVFYADEVEAGARLGAYLRAPPHLAFYRGLVKPGVMLLWGQAEKAACWVHFHVDSSDLVNGAGARDDGADSAGVAI